MKLWACILLFPLWFASAFADEPVKLIFDTDITGDVDDVLALAMIHSLMNREKCELLAVTVSKKNELAAPFVDAVNTFYGRPDIPIGISKTAPHRDSKYLTLAEVKNDDGKLRYPRDIGVSSDPEDAVKLLRKTLSEAEDHSLAIIQVGLATNLADFLNSDGGINLVKKKVGHLSVMAGAFETINGDNHFLEANVRNHVLSMQTLAAKWPAEVPVIWSGFKIGISVTFPRKSIAKDFNYTGHHIVKEAYLLHSGPNHDRPCWDLTSVLYSVFPERGYFGFSPKGSVSVADDGFTRFRPTKNGRDRYLLLSPVQKTRVSEALIQLVNQPPRS